VLQELQAQKQILDEVFEELFYKIDLSVGDAEYYEWKLSLLGVVSWRIEQLESLIATEEILEARRLEWEARKEERKYLSSSVVISLW
jgi:hypothetical protein